MWRKNRAHYHNDSNCVGVDMNRNWGYMWGGKISKLPNLNQRETLGINVRR